MVLHGRISLNCDVNSGNGGDELDEPHQFWFKIDVQLLCHNRIHFYLQEEWDAIGIKHLVSPCGYEPGHNKVMVLDELIVISTMDLGVLLDLLLSALPISLLNNPQGISQNPARYRGVEGISAVHGAIDRINGVPAEVVPGCSLDGYRFL